MDVVYSIYIDRKSMSNSNIRNIEKSLNMVDENFPGIIKVSECFLTEEHFLNLTKLNVLITSDEEDAKKWQVNGGKLLFFAENKRSCYPSFDKLIITNDPEDEDPINHIYDFILKCLHIY